MADAKSAARALPPTTTEAAPGLLDQIITNTKQTEPDRAQDLVKTLVEQALAGTVTFDATSRGRSTRPSRRSTPSCPSSSTRSCTTRSSSSSKAAGAACTTW